METQTPLGFNEWPFDGPPGHEDSRSTMDYRSRTSKTNPAPLRPARAFAGDQLDFDPDVLQEDADDYQSARSRTFQMNYDEPRHSQAQLQRYQQQRQYQRAVQREFSEDVPYRRAATHSEHELHGRDVRGRDALEEMPFDPPRRIQQRTGAASPLAAYGRGANGLMRESHARMTQTRRYNGPSSHSPGFGPRMDELPLESAVLDMYPDEMDTSTAPGDRRREYGQPQLVVGRQRIHQQISRRADRLHDDEMLMAPRRPFNDPDLPRDRRGGESRAVYEELVPTPTSTGLSQNNNYGNLSHDGGADGADVLAELSSSRQRVSQPVGRPQKTKRSRADEDSTLADSVPVRAKGKAGRKSAAASTTSSEDKDAEALPKRRCGRKSMNYSSEQKRERNRAAVKKCRQRQALKLEYLQHKAESLAAENQALSEMLVKNAELDAEQRTSLTRGIQMDILLKIKEIFTQSLPKDFVLDADSIWDLNSVLAVSMPSRCYYGIESIKDFWRTSLRMRNKGKIRSFWAWLFRLPPGDRFSEFEIQPFSATSNLYFISWTTKSTPPLAGSMVIMFGNGHRVTLHVECFGWLIWRYLLTNEPFPEPALD
ncbi:hypothetical protein P3T76_012929 [Phytophthora citrophthora]|uniref:BZIP domain-containing protein n=1 Tax=Phytophthora citrophthora TaxID=4793 RepID=A0AAD9G4M0_9STRA|nr:hypothetical protein P3T76_012929 [Phytophthora citrophthora]